MIQELLGAAGLLGEDRKFSFHGVGFEGLPSYSPPTTAITTTTVTTPPSTDNLRCPRCDSPNTKFCYYNNYNLTQPRHFCKTCRRYWTKGGALRNVPIGGGCRKNKSTIASTTGKSTAARGKNTDFKSNLGSGFDHEHSTSPFLWGSPQNSQLLALLRATPNPNPNPNSSSTADHMFGSHVALESASNVRTVGLDPLGQIPIGLYGSSFRNNQHQPQQHQIQQSQSMLHNDVQNTGIQELYQRLRSSVNSYPDHSPTILSRLNSMPTSSSSMIEPPPPLGGETGCWNPPFTWSDLSNGAYH